MVHNLEKFELPAGNRRASKRWSMLPYLQRCEPPSDDKRWKIIAATMRKLGNQRNALIEALHSIQQAFGYIDKQGLTFVAGTLRIPLSQVYGTATFYHYFTMKPPGAHTCVVCTGTACHIKGAGSLLKALGAAHGVKPGETTGDGSLSLLTARCFGTCGLAPVAVIDGEMVGRLTSTLLEQRLQRLVRHVS
jgi:bidirectional [NiFe] hydrogenase diaphorase subunit